MRMSLWLRMLMAGIQEENENGERETRLKRESLSKVSISYQSLSPSPFSIPSPRATPKMDVKKHLLVQCLETTRRNEGKEVSRQLLDQKS